MALTEADREFIKLAARDGAFQALTDSEPDRRRMARSEAEKAVTGHVDHCPLPAQLRTESKLRLWRLLFYLAVAGGSGGLASRLFDIKAIAALFAK